MKNFRKSVVSGYVLHEYLGDKPWVRARHLEPRAMVVGWMSEAQTWGDYCCVLEGLPTTCCVVLEEA